MTTTTPRRAPHKPFVPWGTPRQQDSWTRQIERDLVRKAKKLRREAARLEKLAKAIEDRRLAQKSLRTNDLCFALNTGASPFATRQLAGVSSTTPRESVIDKVLDLPPMPRRLDHLAIPGTPIEDVTGDALSQAVAIAQSASCTDIDWTREPLSDRERTVRQRWLKQQVDDAGGLGYLSLRCEVNRIPSTLRDRAYELLAALDEAERRWHSERETHRRSSFADFADELDDQGETA